MSLQQPFLKVAAEQWMPWAAILPRQNGSVHVEGPMGDILRILSTQLRFEYEVVQPPDGHWGIPKGNGSWTGMIGMILDGEVEFALGPFIASLDRQEVVDFTAPVHTDGIAILTVRPTVKNDIRGFIKAFTSEVWLCILCSLIVVSISLSLIQKVEGKLYEFPTKDAPAKSMMWTLKAVAQESSNWMPKKDPSRVLVTTWLLASLVFMSSYGGILTAMLTAPIVKIPIDSLEDLVTQSELPWKLLSGSFLINYLKDSEDDIRRTAYFGSSGTIPDCWFGKEAITSGEYAGICGETTLRKVISWDFSTTGRCHLYMAREMVYSNSFYGLVFSKKSPYLDEANKVINILKESGIMSHWLSQRITNTSLCMRPPTADRTTDGVAALDLEAFGGSFIVLAGGLLLALLIFLLEITVVFLS